MQAAVEPALRAGRDQVGRLMAMAGAIIRSRTAQAKNDDSESRKWRTDDSAKPLFVRMINARVIFRICHRVDR